MKNFRSWAIAYCVLLPWVVQAAAQTFISGQGWLGTAVNTSISPTSIHSNQPPLEGPLIYLAFTATDKRSSDELDTVVSMHAGLEGNLLPAATTDFSLGILDSGANTHLLSYPVREERGITGSFISSFTYSVAGVDSAINVNVSMPVGLFAHGLQDLSGGVLQTGLVVGQGNFPCGANSLANFNAGRRLPTSLGAPLLAHFPAAIKNSQQVVIEHNGERISSPSVEFFLDPLDPSIPSYGNRIPIRLSPGGDTMVAYFAIPDFLNGGYDALLPAMIGSLSGSLYVTDTPLLSVEEGSRSRNVELLVDTGSQISILSENVAADLGLILSDPDFEVELEGTAGPVIAPGFYVDGMSIPSSGGDLVFTQVPFVIWNLTGPSGGILDGSLGSNLLANRNVVFNGAATPPYLDISDPVVSPDITITSIRVSSSGRIEVDWLSEPAAPLLELQTAPSLPAAATNWTSVATGSLSTITGTISVTNTADQAIFRLTAP